MILMIEEKAAAKKKKKKKKKKAAAIDTKMLVPSPASESASNELIPTIEPQPQPPLIESRVEEETKQPALIQITSPILPVAGAIVQPQKRIVPNISKASLDKVRLLLSETCKRIDALTSAKPMITSEGKPVATGAL